MTIIMPMIILFRSDQRSQTSNNCSWGFTLPVQHFILKFVKKV